MRVWRRQFYLWYLWKKNSETFELFKIKFLCRNPSNFKIFKFECKKEYTR